MRCISVHILNNTFRTFPGELKKGKFRYCLKNMPRKVLKSLLKLLGFLVFVPVESFLVELDDDLGDFGVGLLSRNEVSFVRILPFDEEVELSGVIGGPDDLVGLETSREPLRLQVAFLRGLFLRLGRLGFSFAFGRFLLLLPGVLLERLDDVVAVEVVDGLPGVVGVVPVLPFDQVLRLAFLHPLLNDGLHLVLFFLVRHRVPGLDSFLL